MSLLQENVYFSYRKVNKNAYFTLFEVNKNVNLVIFNMSKIAFCRFATLVVIVMLVGFWAIGYRLRAMGYWLWGIGYGGGIGFGRLAFLMHHLVILCLSFGEVPMKFL